jgi:hypothetical protein
VLLGKVALMGLLGEVGMRTEKPHRARATFRPVARCERLGIGFVGVLALVALPSATGAQTTKKTFVDYIQTTPIACPLATNTWGCTAAQVAARESSCGNEDPPQISGPAVPRDTCNGIESAKDPPDYYYWDGKIIRATDGVYHMIADRWPGASIGFQNYTKSEAVHATSNSPLGPYTETGYCYSFWTTTTTPATPHSGHNTTAIQLLDGTYALSTGEGGVAPFAVWTSTSLAGPWTACSDVNPNATSEIIDTNGLSLSYNATNAPLDSNVSILARPDGQFELVQRRGMIGLASNVCGPYKLQQPTNTYPSDQQPPSGVPSIYPNRQVHTDPLVGTPSGPPATPQPTWPWAEDPFIWFSGGKYHVLYDYPIDRVGYHLTSLDGIHDWTDEGFAYDPRMADTIFVYTDGTAVGWFNMERPSVLMEDGHVTHLTFAVSDVDKNSEIPANSDHGSKVVVIPFDGVRFDCETGLDSCDGGVDAGGDAGGMGGKDGGAADVTIGGVGGHAGSSSGGTSSGGGGEGGGGGAGKGGVGGKASGGGAGGGGVGGNGGMGGGSNTVTSAGSGGAASGGASGNAFGTGGSTAKAGGATASAGCACVLGQSRPRREPPWYWVLGLAFLILRRRRP